MPKRNREQQEKHNEARRKITKAGRKALFSMKYIETKHADLVKEANNLYDFLYEIYPNKHDLTKTELYINCMNKPGAIKNILKCSTVSRNKSQISELLPILNIPLMQTKTSPPFTDNYETQTPDLASYTEEMPVNLPILTEDETNSLIRDLQQDPDLNQYFRDIALNEVTVPHENVAKQSESVESIESEIDRIIKEEFEALGADLPNIMVNDDELLFH